MKVRRHLLAAALTASFTLASAQTAVLRDGPNARFTYAGGTYSSAISGDGSTIMGYNWVTLAELDGVSADGTVMVGYGQSPRTKAFPYGNFEPFRAVLPAPE